MLCPSCDEYRFPRQITTAANKDDTAKSRENDKVTSKDTQQSTGRQRASASAPSVKCGECSNNVSSRDKGVQCEACDTWHHTRCCSIPDPVYDFLGSQNGSGMHWFCKYCDKAAGKILTRMSAMQGRQDKMETALSEIKDELNKVRTDLNNKANSQDLEYCRRDINSIKSDLGDAVKSDLEAQKKSWAESIFHQVDTKMETVQDRIIEVKLAESIGGSKRQRRQENKCRHFWSR